MTFAGNLDLLESLELIRAAPAQPEAEFELPHALVQDADYAALSEQDRRRLHQMVGETLERLYPGRRDELAPALARHFAAAGDASRAAHYYRIAGERAAMTDALPEAVNHYTCAITISEELSQPTACLYRARGSVYAKQDDFARARADYEAALRLAHGAGEARAEWETLLDMGLLWAERDHARTRQYYKRALELAQALGDPRALARSRNRMGNWLGLSLKQDYKLGHADKAVLRANNHRIIRNGLDRAFYPFGQLFP